MAEPEKQVIIKLENVDFWYDRGKPNEFHALQNVNFEINKGDYVAFFGPSGSGKSSLLYLISGVEQCQSGKIFINGRDISSFTKQELAIYRQVGVGMVFQSFNLIPSLTVLDNVALPMSFLGVGPARAREEALQLLERMEIAQFKTRFPYELSGGQQQRVAIARALANNPPIIIADEPLGNLDSKNAENALQLLKEINEKDGRTVIIVTHEAWSLRDAKRIFHIRDGVVQSEEAPAKKPQERASEIYENMSPEKHSMELAARTLSNVLLQGYSIEEIRRFEFFLNQRFVGNIDKDMFAGVLARPYKHGGVGLWHQKAERLAQFAEDVIDRRREIYDLLQELHMNHEVSLEAEVERIRTWLLQEYRGKISSLQQLQLDEIISERIRNVIDAQTFRRVLNVSSAKCGLGFSFRAAQKLGERMELVLNEGAEKLNMVGIK